MLTCVIISNHQFACKSFIVKCKQTTIHAIEALIAAWSLILLLPASILTLPIVFFINKNVIWKEMLTPKVKYLTPLKSLEIEHLTPVKHYPVKHLTLVLHPWHPHKKYYKDISSLYTCTRWVSLQPKSLNCYSFFWAPCARNSGDHKDGQKICRKHPVWVSRKTLGDKRPSCLMLSPLIWFNPSFFHSGHEKKLS